MTTMIVDHVHIWLQVSFYFSWYLWTSHGVSCWQPRGWVPLLRAATNSGLSFLRWSQASASASASASSSGLSSHRRLGFVPPWSILHQPGASQLPGLSEHHGRRWSSIMIQNDNYTELSYIIILHFTVNQNFPPDLNHKLHRGSMERVSLILVQNLLTKK